MTKNAGNILLSALLGVNLLFCQCSSKSVQTSRFDDLPKPLSADGKAQYQLRYKNGSSEKISDGDFVYDSFNKTVRVGNRVYPLDQIENVSASKRVGRQTLKGLAIGAAAGLVVGSAILAAGLSSDGSGCEDRAECQGIAAIVGAAGFVGSVGLGSVIGLGVGALTPKKQTTIYVP